MNVMPKLYGIGQGVTPDPKNTSAGAPPPGTDAKSGTAKDPGRDALGRFLKGRRLGRPKGSLDKRPRVQRAKVADIAYALTFGNEDYRDSLQIRLLWGDVPARVVNSRCIRMPVDVVPEVRPDKALGRLKGTPPDRVQCQASRSYISSGGSSRRLSRGAPKPISISGHTGTHSKNRPNVSVSSGSCLCPPSKRTS
jgi:hypothetical protein